MEVGDVVVARIRTTVLGAADDAYAIVVSIDPFVIVEPYGKIWDKELPASYAALCRADKDRVDAAIQRWEDAKPSEAVTRLDLIIEYLNMQKEEAVASQDFPGASAIRDAVDFFKKTRKEMKAAENKVKPVGV